MSLWGWPALFCSLLEGGEVSGADRDRTSVTQGAAFLGCTHSDEGRRWGDSALPQKANKKIASYLIQPGLSSQPTPLPWACKAAT
ncbi:rCG63601 [Rattus norvegicus]|uniref:RCG63601 n=1 Tax=Rattus norvegicus TaxID=10116 RepID=A6JLL0_RAT|nr:rCG63601 [Rattus norvegicus]